MNVLSAHYFAAACRWTIAVILMIAAAGKAYRPVEFVAAMRRYSILPAPLVPYAALVLVITEFVLAVGLILSLLMPWTATAVAGLFVLFASAIAANLIRGRIIPCGCGFAQKSRIEWYMVFRNLLFASASLFAITAATRWRILGTSLLFVALIGLLCSHALARRAQKRSLRSLAVGSVTPKPSEL